MSQRLTSQPVAGWSDSKHSGEEGSGTEHPFPGVYSRRCGLCGRDAGLESRCRYVCND